MRPEKDRDWELPFGSPGELSVLMDIRDELKALGHQITRLQELLVAERIQQVEKNMAELMTKAQTEGLIEDDKSAYPPPAPTPPPPAKPVHTARRKR